MMTIGDKMNDLLIKAGYSVDEAKSYCLLIAEEYNVDLDAEGDADSSTGADLSANHDLSSGSSSNLSLNTDSNLNSALQIEACFDACRRVAAGEPLPYITGHQAFYREDYFVDSNVLIPRPDTEILVEAALKFCGACEFPMGDINKVSKGAVSKGDFLHFADFCTGTGCVGISVTNQLTLSGYDVDAYLTDVSSEALRVCNRNVSSQLSSISKEAASVKVVNCDLRDHARMLRLIKTESLDFIVSNPPYITGDEMKLLDKSVADYEPELALYGGEDGLEFYYLLAEYGKTFLKKGAAIICEHGYDQGDAVRAIFINEGYSNVITLKDYGGNDRVCFAIREM
ncbi:MAG: peptide chain release factor N(5)-glutamine methyltransferase [Clostridia bacterium]|nr:peptide chain release factor N(5)-glutamine methyltransferase [Clostridia bacterium]